VALRRKRSWAGSLHPGAAPVTVIWRERALDRPSAE
jgi:hypothetical protein